MRGVAHRAAALSRIRRLTVGLMAAGAACLLVPALAGAAPNGNVSVTDGRAEVTGTGGGTGNPWTITASGGGGITVGLTGGDLFAGTGCSGSGASITCAGPLTEITVNLSAMTSAQTVNVDASVATRVVIIGTTSDDTLNGGSGDDQITGGRGADVIRGNAGSDTAFYGTEASFGGIDTDRITGVDVSLDGIANDGSAGYDDYGPDGKGADNVHSTTENVFGTEWADVLTGDGQANSLNGRPGDDVLTGGAGSDRLVGQFGNDTLNAQDGEADAEVNCNNSDASRDQQPNTVRYDAGLDSPVNCALTGGGSGSTAGGSGAGGGAERGDFKLIDNAGTWTVPKSLMPRKSGSKFAYTRAKQVAKIVAEAPFPITVTWKQVGLFAVPAQYRQADIPEDAVVRVSPTVGDVVSGSSTSPGEIIITTYTGAVDLPRSCPYADPDLTRVITGDDLPVAAKALKRMRCSFRVTKMQFTERFGQPTVAAARVAEVDGARVVALTVTYPSDTLSLSIGPDGGANELTLDGDGTLRVAPRNLTTIRVRALDSSLGVPSTKNTTIEVRTNGGKVLASQTIGSGANGGVQSLTFPVKEFEALRVVATAYDDSKMKVLHGSRFIRVTRPQGILRTADLRCFEWKPATEKWKTRDCLKLEASGKARAGGQRTLVSSELARLVTERVLGNSIQGKLNTFDQADDICFSDKQNVVIPSIDLWWQSYWDEKSGFKGAPGCSDAEIIELMRVFKLKPVLLSGSSSSSGDPILASVAWAATVGMSGGELRQGKAPAIDASKAPVLGIERDNVITFGKGLFIDARTGLDGDALINLDGSTLINLDGSTLINLDGSTLTAYDNQSLIAAGGQNIKAMNQGLLNILGGGTLINLDGSTLINLDGATMVSQGGQHLIADDGGSLRMDGPLNMVPARGKNLIAAQALALKP